MRKGLNQTGLGPPTRTKRPVVWDELRILLVEDDPVQQKVIRSLLTRGGANVTVTPVDGADRAAAELAASEYDCVILDHFLPDVLGVEFLRVLREEGYTLPIILLTGLGSEAVESEALAAGASAYLSKSGLTADTLRATVVQVVKNAQDG